MTKPECPHPLMAGARDQFPVTNASLGFGPGYPLGGRGHWTLVIWISLVILVWSLVICAPPAAAQENLGRFDRQLDQLHRDQDLRIDQSIPAADRTMFDYGAFVTASYLSLDDQNNKNHVLREYDLVGYARINLDQVQEVFLRGRTSYRDFNNQDSFDGLGDQWIEPDFDRAYYRFDLRRAMQAYQGKDSDDDLVIEAGRDLVYWGNGLTLSQTLDGVMMQFDSKLLNIEGIAGVTPTRTTDFDTTRPNFDHNTRRGFYGVQVSKQVGAQKPYAYALLQRDYNRNFEFNLPDEHVQTRFRYNSFYLGLGSQGAITDRLLYGVEMTYESGDTLSNSFTQPPNSDIAGVPQTDDNIHAFAADARLDYLFGDPRQTRASAEGIISSGDPDRLNSTTDTFGGNRPHTGDNAFNAFGYLNTGDAFAPDVSNLMSFRLGLSTLPFPNVRPLEHLQAGVDGLIFGKTQRAAPFDEPTVSGQRYLGWEPDFFINWQVTNDVTIAMRYGIFFPGNAIVNDDDNRQFFFAGVTYAF